MVRFCWSVLFDAYMRGQMSSNPNCLDRRKHDHVATILASSILAVRKQVNHREYRCPQICPSDHSPIQLLLPPGLCKLVCPIFTTSYPPALPSVALLDGVSCCCDSLAGVLNAEKKDSSSARGLGTLIGEAQFCPPAECNDSSSLPPGVIGIVKNDSACHSYHTWRSFVKRQIDTCNSEWLGRYSGSY